MPDIEKAIVLHVDTLSEGVNVEGFTGVMFLSDIPPTVMKLLQNVGRALRLNKKDRKYIRDKFISPSNYSLWVKPFSYIILPIYSQESEESQNHISKAIKGLRDLGVDSNYLISFGSDMAKGTKELPVPGEDEKDYPDPRRKIIQNIEHQIETLEAIEAEAEYISMEEYEKIDFILSD